ncbi:PREDICTED: uncharacterized protein LOC105569471 [Vollenhovia emeryi]|uniref:uncharacterized protein LOC105569471 n=1 Tax=Vollenhovia emeryi TaxID=411798 RepID=UPI0005F37928|nr:PREDICTED: uncharacterized protein LOC105569471 [Vollenhovia emeryi]XP_011881358.1 PREDICTED: uncharacterized protein LOC105569471 [Vollenhovia emeryi]XP_011881359.1 PREDICTED: uncharacterized protein LOC105569471 [Vollenhovia emeryi]
MELDTVNAYNTVGMEQGLSGDPWDCLFGSDSISDAIQGRPEMFYMGIRRCDNTGEIGWLGPGLGFDFDDVLTEPDDEPLGFNDKSRSSNSNLEELNLDSDNELALTLDPNLVLPHNMSIDSPATNSDAAMLETASVEENAAENEGDETENESEVERTENDEENESEEEEEEEEEIENEENEHNETEDETEEEETEEEEEDEEEETEDDEQDVAVQQPLTPLSVEAPTSMSSSSANVGARTLTAAAAIAASPPTIQLTRLHHSKISTISGTVKVQDIKMLAANQGIQTLHQIRKQMSYNNNVHDVSAGATATVMIQAAKREKDLTGSRDNSYPKPAYSYSCLIAMALKNSRTGSLPVSEIYNFMCRHFPYFTTAPTGWKNSVRHNLSLNKCFEKIEKPPGNGSQRKGCLWAIHPSKVTKMDEEVRKWSRKDPTAIKRAMVNPDQLELLERGEMKYEGDRHEETYEDAESYADSETGGSAADEAVNDDENVTYDEAKQIDIVDDNIVVEQLYEDLELMDAADLLDTRLNDFPRQEQPLVYELVSCAKRQKTLTSSPNDYVYQQVDATSPRKKAHLVALRPGAAAPGAGSLLEAE